MSQSFYFGYFIEVIDAKQIAEWDEFVCPSCKQKPRKAEEKYCPVHGIAFELRHTSRIDPVYAWSIISASDVSLDALTSGFIERVSETNPLGDRREFILPNQKNKGGIWMDATLVMDVNLNELHAEFATDKDWEKLHRYMRERRYTYAVRFGMFVKERD